MIPIALQPEPPTFDQRVRQPGVRWLGRKGIVLTDPLPSGTKILPYWYRCLNELYSAYSGICAYVCIYIEPVVGVATADHFVAKSALPSLAYEWDNYRLACPKMNARKQAFDDVLDPFSLAPGTFELVLLTGDIRPTNPSDTATKETIQRLGLDDDDCRKLRSDYYLDYLSGDISADYLRRRAPFVYQEVVRHGRLRSPS